MAKKMSLKIAYNSPFLVNTIFSVQKSVRLAWLLNNHAECEFKRYNDFRYPYHEEDAGRFAIYGFFNQVFRMHVFLLDNISEQGSMLIKGNPKINYLLIFANISDVFNKKEYLKKLRSLSEIQAISELNPTMLEKHKDVFYDLEVFLAEHKYM
ncbi:MAG TPA: IPExxxVDY family protein [Bacteroidales bacterium]|nr:IPExxxVDY family protein [Bacteroidales bacterium]